MCEEIVKFLTIIQLGIYWELDIRFPSALKVTKSKLTLFRWNVCKSYVPK